MDATFTGGLLGMPWRLNFFAGGAAGTRESLLLMGKKVKPACPGTEPSDSTCLTEKGWFAKNEKRKFAKRCCQWPPVFN